EKRRAEQAKRKSPRLKKTLVGVGVPDEAIEPPAVEAKPVATAPAAAEEPEETPAEAKADSAPPPAREVDESAETLALDRSEIGKTESEPAAAEESEAAAEKDEPQPAEA